MKQANDSKSYLTGATSGLGNYWMAINWSKVADEVSRLQMRIAKAVREEKWNKVKSLQWTLTHSFSAKLLAVKRVTFNRGARTPGVDGQVWNTPAKKMKGALSLNRKGYKALPLRRVDIPKSPGKTRPLGIPTMRDRAMQALHLLSLEPIAETTADPNSYGFRPYRACRDAIGQCFIALARSYSPKWVLDADIKACFDWINHDWLLQNIPMDKMVLTQWLKCGYFHNKRLFPTKAGTPQGGIISPTLANMTLDGLEEVIKKSCPRRRKVNFIRYADDFIVTADSRELIGENIIPAINRFLAERGLKLSEEKTRIVRIEEGFDFLGQHLRKYGNKLITTPSKKNMKDFLDKVHEIIRKANGWKCADLIKTLNPIIRGWCYYHRCVQSSKAFAYTTNIILNALLRWATRRNRKRSYKWIKRKYFEKSATAWVFACFIKLKDGMVKLLELIKPTQVQLVRYYKIKGAANPYDPQYFDYFAMRNRLSNVRPITI
jgi:RNA-directed DNA polymerase